MNKHALILGKFMPLHLGHLALIHGTRGRALRTTVLLCVEEREPISGDHRERWLNEELAGDPQFTVRRIDYSDAELPATSVSSRAVSELWTHRLKTWVPDADLIVGSEPYVRYVAKAWGIDYLIFDQPRTQIPISATEIRARPYTHRHYLAPAARPCFVQKIVLHGTESTGKSTLVKHLAERYGTTYVPETAREIVQHTDTVTYDQLPQIAARQAEAITAALPTADGLLFVDTDYWTTLAYARYLFKRGFPLAPEWQPASEMDLCLFCTSNAPYVQDGTRLQPAERLVLDAFHRRARLESGVPVQDVVGTTWAERRRLAEGLVDAFLVGK